MKVEKIAQFQERMVSFASTPLKIRERRQARAEAVAAAADAEAAAAAPLAEAAAAPAVAEATENTGSPPMWLRRLAMAQAAVALAAAADAANAAADAAVAKAAYAAAIADADAAHEAAAARQLEYLTVPPWPRLRRTSASVVVPLDALSPTLSSTCTSPSGEAPRLSSPPSGKVGAACACEADANAEADAEVEAETKVGMVKAHARRLVISMASGVLASAALKAGSRCRESPGPMPSAGLPLPLISGTPLTADTIRPVPLPAAGMEAEKAPAPTRHAPVLPKYRNVYVV